MIELCKADNFCSSMFSDIDSFFKNSWTSDKKCGDFSIDDAFKFCAGSFLVTPTYFQVTFAVLYRWNRCGSQVSIFLIS